MRAKLIIGDDILTGFLGEDLRLKKIVKEQIKETFPDFDPVVLIDISRDKTSCYVSNDKYYGYSQEIIEIAKKVFEGKS